MKLAITGKGGVGKTTLASTLARLYADEGRPVLAADVDPDANLGLALGMSQEEVDSIVPISKMRTLVEERTGANEANLAGPGRITGYSRRNCSCLHEIATSACGLLAMTNREPSPF